MSSAQCESHADETPPSISYRSILECNWPSQIARARRIQCSSRGRMHPLPLAHILESERTGESCPPWLLSSDFPVLAPPARGDAWRSSPLLVAHCARLHPPAHVVSPSHGDWSNPVPGRLGRLLVNGVQLRMGLVRVVTAVHGPGLGRGPGGPGTSAEVERGRGEGEGGEGRWGGGVHGWRRGRASKRLKAGPDRATTKPTNSQSVHPPPIKPRSLNSITTTVSQKCFRGIWNPSAL